MAKAPRIGSVKTRLTPELSAEQAASLSRCFIQDMAQNIAALPHEPRLVGGIAFSGEESAFDGLLPDNFLLLPQRGKDLGERLRHAAEDLFAAGFSTVCLINSDSPTLPQSRYVDAATALWSPGDRVVLGAASDGGYYLIGLKRPEPHLFSGIDWSTPRVFAQTMARAAEAGLAAVALPEWYDVDDWESLKTLYRELLMPGRDAAKGSRGYSAPTTARFLRRLATENPTVRRILADNAAELRIS